MSSRSRRRAKKQTPVSDEMDSATKQNLKALEKTDAETAALIQAMLMEDQLNSNPYYDSQYDNNTEAQEKPINPEDLDDDYMPEKIKRQLREVTGQVKKRGPYKKRKRVGEGTSEHPAKKGKTEDAPEEEEEVSLMHFQYGKYSDEEERLFLEALELHGRDWTGVQNHLKTRDKDSIRSHAQKHFIKLYREGKPLPAKVAESGEGHTLSGKPLDPGSTTARKYLTGKYSHLVPAKAVKKYEAARKKRRSEKAASGSGKKKKKSSVKKTKAPFRESDYGVNVGQVLYGKDDIYKDRLREKPSVQWSALGANVDPHTMVACDRFGDECVQPFKVTCHTNALLIADMHAHLARVEIIGFLAGHWDPKNMVLEIVKAFPCMSLATGSDNINVEMDPASEIVIREKIKQQNLQVVGWYHSHPVFQPDPSLLDIENQANYQILFRDEEHDKDPFVGIIVGSYDVRMPTPVSIINWFHVRRSQTSGMAGRPMYVNHELVQSDGIGGDTEKTAFELLATYADYPTRTIFDSLWRYSMDKVDTAAPNGDAKTSKVPISKLSKLKTSLKTRITSKATQEEADRFLGKIEEYIIAKWDL